MVTDSLLAVMAVASLCIAGLLAGTGRAIRRWHDAMTKLTEAVRIQGDRLQTLSQIVRGEPVTHGCVWTQGASGQACVRVTGHEGPHMTIFGAPFVI